MPVKVSTDDWGIYVDETQVAFVNDSSTILLANRQTTVGAMGLTGLDALDAYIPEIRIAMGTTAAEGNPYGAVPVVGLTDTITVPTRMLRDSGF